MRPQLLLPLLVGLLCLTVYLSLAGPTFYWLDSSELSAAAWELGIPHPPGHPLPSLLGRLLCLLPLGTLAFRITLASALAAAAAAALTVILSMQVLRRLGESTATPAWLRPAAATIAGLTVGFSYALGFQAVRAEVYALNLCLLLAGACLLLRWDETGDRRPLLLAGLVGGLALCNHHFLVVLALPGMLLFITVARGRKPGWTRAATGLCLCGLLGLSTLAYLPLRSARGTEVDWGSPHTAERFYWVVSAQAFQKAVNKAAKETVEHRAMGAVFAVVGGLGPLAAAAGLGGLYLLWRHRRSRRAALLLTGVASFNLLSPLTVGFDPLNPDAHGYLAVAVAFLAPALAAFIALVGSGLAARWRRAPALVILVAAVFPAYQAAANLERCDLRRHWQAEETARAQLDLPPKTLALSAYFGSVFNYWAMRVLHDHRPDVEMFHRHFLPMPGRMERLKRRLPDVGAVAPAWLKAQHLLPAGLDTLAARRPVAVEYDLNLLPRVVRGLRPDGLFLSWGSGHGSPAADNAIHQQKVSRWRAALGPVSERESVRAVMYTHYLLAHHACATGNRPLARQHYALARSLGPASLDLKRLARSCGLR